MPETLRTLRERYIYRLFRIGVFLKGVDSIVEMFAGFVILVIGPTAISGIIISMSQDELAEDPRSFFALHALPLAQAFSLTPQAFLGAYLLARGVLKLFLVLALLYNRRWSYPAALVVLGLFLLYEIYLIALGHSLFLSALALFDAVLLWLIWHEYRTIGRVVVQ